MSEKSYKKRFEFQQKIVSRQSEQIEDLKSQIVKLKLELKEKDEIISSVTPLKEELAKEVSDIKGYKKEYKKLIDELRKMKEILNKTVYRGRWWLIKFLLK